MLIEEDSENVSILRQFLFSLNSSKPINQTADLLLIVTVTSANFAIVN